MDNINYATIHTGVATKTCAYLMGIMMLFLLAGCSVALDKTIIMPQAPIPESRKFAVAVLPFEHAVSAPSPEDMKRNQSEKTPDNPELKSLERQYFPARLAQTLRQSPWVKEAYVTPGKTPSVDYLIRGDITESDGEVTEISLTITRCCYQDAFTKSFRLDLSSGDFKESTDPGGTIWNSIVNAVGRYFDTVAIEERSKIVEERVAMYSQRRDRMSLINQKSMAMLNQAAHWERENLLGRVSKMAFSFSDEVAPTHAKWQEKVTKTGEEKRQKEFETGLQTLMAFANAGMGMYASAKGIGAVGSYLTMAAGGNIMSAMQANDEAKKLKDSIAKMTNVFAVALEPQTIELEGRVYKLTGDIDARIAQIQQIVRQVILLETES